MSLNHSVFVRTQTMSSDAVSDPFSGDAGGDVPAPPLSWLTARTGVKIIDEFLDDVAHPNRSYEDCAPPDMKITDLPKTIERFMKALSPYVDFIDAAEDVMHYKNPRVTFSLLFYYILLVWYGKVVPGVLLLANGLIMIEWAQQNDYLPRGARESQLEDEIDSIDPTPAETTSQEPASQRRGLLGDLVDFAVGKVKVAQTKYKAANKAAGKVNEKLLYYSTIMEKGICLVDWSIPHNTWIIVAILSGLYLITLIVPWDYIALVIKIQIGVKAFLTEYLFQNKEYLKLKYSFVYRFWMNIPTQGKGKNVSSSVYGTSSTTSRVADVVQAPSPSSAQQIVQERKGIDSQASPKAKMNTTSPVAQSASAPYSISGPSGSPTKESLVTALKERVLGSWQIIYMNVKRPAKLVLTEGHLCVQRGAGDQESGTFVLQFSKIVSVSKGESKPTSMMAGWTLNVVAKPDDSETTEETTTHRFSLQKRDEVYNKICAATGIPPESDLAPQTDPTTKKAE